MNITTDAPQSVGIDVAKHKIDLAIRMTNDQYHSSVSPHQTEEDIIQIIEWFNQHGVTTETPIIIESTGSYHWLVCLLLSEYGYRVHLINPLITKQYQRGSIRGSKTDPIDAKRLADIGVHEGQLPLFFDSRETLSQKRYLSLLHNVQGAKQKMSAAYNDAIESSQSIGIDLDLHCIETALKQLDTTITILERMITDQASDVAKELAQTKGISLFQATVLCTAVAGRTFEHRDQLIAFFGLDVRTRQSGQWSGKSKLTKRGNAYYRKVLFQIGWSLKQHNKQFQEHYQRLRDEGKHYNTAIISTARKFLKYFFVYHLPKCQD